MGWGPLDDIVESAVDFGAGAYEFGKDALDFGIETAQFAGDACEIAAPFVMCVNPQAGMGMADFGQKMDQLDPHLDKLQSKLNDAESPQAKQTEAKQAEPQAAQQGQFWTGEINETAIKAALEAASSNSAFEITGDESIEELLAKIFGKQLDAKQTELKGMADSGNQDASQNVLIAAKASELTNLAATASKMISTVSEGKTTALGRTT